MGVAVEGTTVEGTTVEGPPGGPGGGGVSFVGGLIAQLAPSHWYRLWESGTHGNGQEASNNGRLGNNEGMQQLDGAPAVTWAAENPMASEAQQTAVEFNPSSSTVGGILRDDDDDDLILNAGPGTQIIFFKAFANAASEYLFSQTNGGGASGGGFRVSPVASDTSLTYIFFGLADGDGTYQESFTVVGGIALNVWHMWACRQPADGTGFDFFLDGVFIPNSSLTQGGTASVNTWWGSTFNFAMSTNALGCRPRDFTTSLDKFDGRLFNAVNVDRIVTNDELTGIWDRAVANGL